MIFDRDAPLPLKIHRIEMLRLQHAIRDGAGGLQQTIAQGRLAVIDVGDDAEIPDLIEGSHLRGAFYPSLAMRVKTKKKKGAIG
jgi:hypothetical protein